MSKNVAQVHLVNAMHEDDVDQDHDHDAVDVDHDDDVEVEHLSPCVAPWCYIVKGRACVKEEKCLLWPKCHLHINHQHQREDKASFRGALKRYVNPGKPSSSVYHRNHHHCEYHLEGSQTCSCCRPPH